MITLRSSRIAFVGILFALSASSVSAMSCAIDVNGKTTCPTSEQVDSFYASQAAAPVCDNNGTSWIHRESDPPAMVQLAKCAGCTAVCSNVGTKSEGWYSSCDGSLIEWAHCGTKGMAVCTMDAKQCPDGSYVGRDGNNNCEWQECPGKEQKLVFSDVLASHRNAQAIAYVQSQGIVEGYADGTYRPDQTINRAEFVKILVNAQFPSLVSACMLGHGGAASFLMDLDTEAWYAKHVCVAFDKQIIQGYPDGTFRPSTTLNFAEAAKIISLSFEIAAPGIAAHEPWYAPYVRDLERYNAIPPSINSFDHQITRGEMAEMIWRLKASITYLPSARFESFEALDAYCTSSPEGSAIGSLLYPRSPEYAHLAELGQIFTAADCGEGRLQEVVGGREAIYRQGSRIDVRLQTPLSVELLLKDIGYACYELGLSGMCETWKMSDAVPVSELLRLKPYVEYFIRDDCTNCG